jgi:hypothetical protein
MHPDPPETMVSELVFTKLAPADAWVVREDCGDGGASWEEKWTAAAVLCWNGGGRE